MKNFFVNTESIETRQLSAKTNLYNIIEVFWLQGVITEGVKEVLHRELTKINDSPYEVVQDLIGKQLEITDTHSTEQFYLEVSKKPLQK